MNVQTLSETRLHGRWLFIARAGWIVLVLMMLSVSLAGYVEYARVVGQVCTGSALECSGPRFTPAEAAEFQRQGVPLEWMMALRFGALAFNALTYCLIGLAIFGLKSDDWMALLVALFLIGTGTFLNSAPTSAFTRAYPAGQWLIQALSVLTYMLFPLFFALFPNGRIAPHWMRWLTPLWCIVFAVSVFVPNINRLPPVLVPLLIGLSVAAFATLMMAQVMRYRWYSTPRERERTKWAVFGVVLFIGLFLLTVLLATIVTDSNILLGHIVGTLGFDVTPALLPLFIGIAVLRSRLFDIDIIIRRTLQYSVISALLALVYFGGVVVLQRIFTSLTGQGQNQLVTVLSTLAIAALFAPLRRRVQDVIDRRFYRKKYDAAKVIAEFGATCRDETDLDKLAASLIAVVQETMQPESVSLWLRDSNAKPALSHRDASRSAAEETPRRGEARE